MCMCVNAYAFLTPFIQYHYSFSQLVKKVILALYLLYCRKRVTLNFNFSSLFYTLFFFPQAHFDGRFLFVVCYFSPDLYFLDPV